MKRDFKVIVAILNRIIEEPTVGFTLESREIAGIDEALVTYHIDMLLKAGIVDGHAVANRFDGLFRITGLSMEGHDFADNLKTPGVWERLTQRLGESTHTVSVGVLMQVASKLATQVIGEQLGLNS